MNKHQQTIKCLSIRPPYAQWIAMYQQFIDANVAPKVIENRTWTTRYRGPVLIHSSKTFEEDALWHWPDYIEGLDKLVPMNKEGYEDTFGKIIAIANIVDIVATSKDPWFVGDYGWVFDTIRPLKTPIAYRGQLYLFDVPRSALAGVEL